MSELSGDALEKAARAGRDGYYPDALWPEEDRAEQWRNVARRIITAYKDATTPLEFWCTACRTRFSWVRVDVPPEIQCFCGAMVSTGRNGDS